LFEENRDDNKPRPRRGDTILAYVTIWFLLTIVAGAFVYDFWSLPFLGIDAYGPGAIFAKNPIAILSYFVWLVVTTLFLAPYLTKKFIGLLYPVEKRPSLPIRKRTKAIFAGLWEFLKDVSHFFRTILFSYYVAFLLPWGLIVAIAFGGWFYFLPFFAANILVAYRFNKARKVRGVEAYDDKHFTNYEKSLDEYMKLVKRSIEQKEKRKNQTYP
jgi:hypothetical protein